MRKAASESLESIVHSSISEAMARVVPRLARAIEARAAAQAEDIARLTKPGRSRRGQKPRRVRVEITKWTADARARRVPTFVIEATGLDTKKKIVAKYGPATFEKGKPVPPVLAEENGSKLPVKRKGRGKNSPEKQTAPVRDEKKALPAAAARAVVGRPPVIRKRVVTA